MTVEALSETEVRALEALVRFGELSCTRLGERVWEGSRRHRGSAPFARGAGKLLKRLRERGLVGLVWRRGSHATWWEITREGRAALAAHPRPAAARDEEAARVP